MKRKLELSELIFKVISYLFLTMFSIMCLYPFVYAISAAISGRQAVEYSQVVLFPKQVQFAAFKRMFSNNMFWNSYSNTLFITLYGTIWALGYSILGAYALSKKRLLFRKFFNFFLVPSEIEEAAIVDGATEFQVLSKVYIPMSKSTIATVALFFGISRWNGYFWARQMISNSNEHPLMVFIRLLLEEYTDAEAMAGWNEVYASDSVIYALIVCSIVPILIIYPFIQKYFAKGVNMGGVKE